MTTIKSRIQRLFEIFEKNAIVIDGRRGRVRHLLWPDLEIHRTRVQNRSSGVDHFADVRKSRSKGRSRQYRQSRPTVEGYGSARTGTLLLGTRRRISTGTVQAMETTVHDDGRFCKTCFEPFPTRSGVL